MGRPQNVRIVRPDGTEVPCDLIHLGYNEDNNMDEWEVCGPVFRLGLDKLAVGMLPARTGISFATDKTAIVEEDECP